MQVGDKNFRVWRGRDQLAVDCDRVAASVVASLAGVDRPLFLCMLSGAFVFAADLLRRIPGDCDVEERPASCWGCVGMCGAATWWW